LYCAPSGLPCSRCRFRGSACSRETAGLSVAKKQKAVRLEVLHIQGNMGSMWPQYGDDRPSMAGWEDGKTGA
jgi:hypothetical protein